MGSMNFYNALKIIKESGLEIKKVTEKKSVNEWDVSGYSTPSKDKKEWIRLVYTGSDPDIKAKCRKLYTDEQLAQYKILSQKYIYDVIVFTKNDPSDEYEAADRLVRRNLDVIKQDNSFGLSGPSYDRKIDLDKYLNT